MMNKLLNASEVLVLAKIFENNSISMFNGMTVNEVQDNVATVNKLAEITIRRILTTLQSEGYIDLGIKRTDRKNAYYATKKGIDLIEKMIEEGGK